MSTTIIEQRLEQLRGNASRRSPSVQALASYAPHADCRLASLAFAAGINLDRLLRGTRFQAAFGQSPFAITRGLAFEERLRANDHALALQLLRGPLALPADACAVNLRTTSSSGPDRMAARAAEVRELLRRILRRDPAAPRLLDGGVLAGNVGGTIAWFEADGLAAAAAGLLRVAEVKSFPRVDDRVDPEKLGAALDQLAVYVLLLRRTVADLLPKADPERLVSDVGLLITAKNVGLTPVLAEPPVGNRVRRVARLLAEVPRAADVIAAAPAGLSFAPVADTTAEEPRRLNVLHDLADRVGTAYEPGCLSRCGNARFCRERAYQAGNICISGTTTLRLLPNITRLDRAEELSRGAAPTPEEAPAAALLERAGRLYDFATKSPRRLA